jgi:hypothetical protein
MANRGIPVFHEPLAKLSFGIAIHNGQSPQVLKPRSFQCTYGTTKEAAEKGCILGEKPEVHISGAKAPAGFIGFVPGINPRPTARPRFSAASKVVP